MSSDERLLKEQAPKRKTVMRSSATSSARVSMTSRTSASPRAISVSRPPRQTSLHTLLPIGSPARTKLKQSLKPRTTHGGEPAQGKRKTARPFTTQAPLHLVLKATRAKGPWSLLHRKHRAKVQSMIYAYAARFKVRVYRSTNVGNHLHLLVKAKERKALADFLRVLAGRVAVVVTGAEKGVKRIGKFWDHLTWSRLVNWGQDFFQVRQYLEHNYEQANPRAEILQNPPPEGLDALGDLWAGAG